MSNLLLERTEGIVEITLNRPESGNALTPDLTDELADVANQCVGDASVRAMIITGSGRMFCAGGDLAAMADAGDGCHATLLRMTQGLHMAISRFVRMNAPVVMAVNGTAAGGGFGLAISGDLILAGESANFLLAYTNAGLSPDSSSSWFLPRKIGQARASELMLTNSLLTAEQALDWGLINRVVPDAELMDEARELAAKLASGPTLAYGKVKRLLAESFTSGLETQMEHEARGIADSSMSNDGQEGIAAFLEKRKPSFSGE